MLNQFPYTDFHQLNLDWVLKKVKELDEKMENLASTGLEDYINKYYNQLMMQAMYDPSTETLILYRSEVINNG